MPLFRRDANGDGAALPVSNHAGPSWAAAGVPSATGAPADGIAAGSMRAQLQSDRLRTGDSVAGRGTAAMICHGSPSFARRRTILPRRGAGQEISAGRLFRRGDTCGQERGDERPPGVGWALRARADLARVAARVGGVHVGRPLRASDTLENACDPRPLTRPSTPHTRSKPGHHDTEPAPGMIGAQCPMPHGSSDGAGSRQRTLREAASRCSHQPSSHSAFRQLRDVGSQIS